MDGHEPTIIAAFAGATVAIAIVGAFRTNRITSGSVVRRRFAQMRTAEETDPLVQSFAYRVMQPVFAALVRLVTSVLPTRILASVTESIETAGRPTTLGRFLVLWLISGVSLPLLFVLMMIASTGGFGLLQLVPVVIWAALAFYVPWTALRRRAKRRTVQIGRDLPDAIDLIITNVEAGLGVQAALLIVAQKFKGPVGEEFGRAVREISLGMERTEALSAMADRSHVPEMRLFARAVTQADQTGIPIARVLRNHSTEVREKRRQRAREQAAKIPVKITFPTVLVMFPTMFLLILGPVALNLMREFGG